MFQHDNSTTTAQKLNSSDINCDTLPLPRQSHAFRSNMNKRFGFLMNLPDDTPKTPHSFSFLANGITAQRAGEIRTVSIAN